MGGYNSGRRASTPDTDDCLRISLTDLCRQGTLKRGTWARRQRCWRAGHNQRAYAALAIVADIDCLKPDLSITLEGHAFGRRINQVVQVVAEPQPLGGERFYAICPLTGERCTVLILPPGKTFFASVRGWGVPYASTREREVDRALRTTDKVEARMRLQSKYTRQRTRERLRQRLQRAAATIEAAERRLGFTS